MTEETHTQERTIEKPGAKYLVPLAIVIAGAFIAGAIFLSSKMGTAGVPVTAKSGDNQPSQVVPQPVGSINKVRSVTAEDHIKGNPDAPVKIVEYSDFECPFCKRFHDTMNQFMKEQGDSGNVAWVFRHFPLDQLHSKARPVAVASECANEQDGNSGFWKFADRYMELTLSNNQTPIETVIPQIVNELGLNQTEFQNCLTGGKFDDHVQSDVDNAIETGGRGTPWSVVIAPNGKAFPLNGAQPLESVRQLINLASQEK